jgi:hypothetical protein
MSLYGPLAKLEEERRRRKIDDLNRRFEATIRHMVAIEKVNDEAYKAKKAVMEAAVTRRPPLSPRRETAPSEVVPKQKRRLKKDVAYLSVPIIKKTKKSR